MPNIHLFRNRIPTFSNIKRIAKLRGIPKNGVNQCIEIALNDF